MVTWYWASDFLGIVFQRDVSRHSGHFMALDVSGVQSAERLSNRHLRHAFLRRIQQKPADKGKPQPRSPLPFHQPQPCAKNNQSVRDDFSAGARNLGGAREIFCYPPDDGAENSAAVQRKAS